MPKKKSLSNDTTARKEPKLESEKKIVKEKPPGYIFGRPTNFTKEMGDKICNVVSTHPIGYDKIQKLYPEFPTTGVLAEWRLRNKDFGEAYLRAKSFQAEIMVEEIDSIMPHGVRYYFDDAGNKRIDAPSASLAIAKANNRKWMAARLAPKRYGDNIAVVQEQNLELKKQLEELKAQLDNKHKKDY